MAGLACLGALALLGAVMVIYPIISGWALTYLWRWFITPVFGVVELSMVQAIGLSLVIRYLTYHQTEAKDNRDEGDRYIAFATLFLRPIFALMFGWAIKQFL